MEKYIGEKISKNPCKVAEATFKKFGEKGTPICTSTGKSIPSFNYNYDPRMSICNIIIRCADACMM